MGKLRSIAVTAAAVATVGTAGVLAAPSASAGTANPGCSAKADVCLDLSITEVWLMHDGKITYGPEPTTVGRPGHETPTGTFTVQYKDIDHYSDAYDTPMPYSVFFTNTGIAFHEGSLSVASHGCVHLGHGDAVLFYNKLQPGDVVEVHS